MAAKYHISRKRLQEDNSTLIGAQSLTDYTPINPKYTISEAMKLQERMIQLQNHLIEVRKTEENVRDEVMEAEHAFHECIQGIKTQVLAQYGPDSLAMQKVGLTRRSEYQSRRMKKAQS